MDNRSIDKFKNDLKDMLGDNKDLINKIIGSLDENRIIQYSEPGEISLLSTPGRILLTIMIDPNMTQRAISVYLGISETMVEKTIKNLVNKGIITKTKLNRKNVYRFNKEMILKNADIQRIPLMLNKLLEEN